MIEQGVSQNTSRRQASDVTYRTHPVHRVAGLAIASGYAALAAEISDLRRRVALPIVVIDGFVGVQWEEFAVRLRAALDEQAGHTGHASRSAGEAAPVGTFDKAAHATPGEIEWSPTADLFAQPREIERLLASYLTDDPVFGRLYHGQLPELWYPERVDTLRERIAERTGCAIVYGYGASLVVDGDLRWYLDVPKDRIQALAARKVICNVGVTTPEPFGAMYKRFYFVDWPMLNKIKRGLLPHLDRFIDATDVAAPRSTSGAGFRQALRALAQRPVRVRPWFAPGPWGGQWMKERFGLPPEQPNYAWSFELIAPENGLLLGGAGGVEDGANDDADDDAEKGAQAGGKGGGEHDAESGPSAGYLECSFDYLLWAETDAVLGARVAARYGSAFPIRFDYLDTMGGTNLSCQTHPRLDYIRDTFGEAITQDETYYIVTNKPGARVYLGLREDADVERFRADAMAARDEGRSFEIADHVNSLPSAPHDLFLIPSGTVHCSGADNLVLEISATPYIYTFKIYDYLRSDLSGALRHVHLDHAFANLDATRTASWVAERLAPTPRVVRSGERWSEYALCDRDELFFAIHRLEFEDAISDSTDGAFLALNLVEGERCALVTPGQPPVELRFAESIIIPACVGAFTVRNLGASPCKIVKAFVKR